MGSVRVYVHKSFKSMKAMPGKGKRPPPVQKPAISFFVDVIPSKTFTPIEYMYLFHPNAPVMDFLHARSRQHPCFTTYSVTL